MKRLRDAMRLEEVWLRQQSRVPWLRDGDRNTAYFQAQARQRKRINRIVGLRRADGSTCANGDEEKVEVLAFYQALYTAQGYNNMGELLSYVLVRVTPDMNQLLEKPFEAPEIHKALFQMAPSKAPGVDGFTVGFFQRHWKLLQHDVVPTVLDFLNGGELPAGLNDTLITLIPKVCHPQNITRYRPIALCLVLYKIAVKALANRARTILDEVIGEEQSAFVLGHLIMDNVLVAYETIHAIKRRKRGNEGVLD